MTEQNFISEEEAELYDRQIRLWGAGVQRSLRNLRVLVIGINGVAAEVCKNLILSGVNSMTMMDPGNVVKEDLNSQYFLYPDSIGQNRAQASLKAAQVLNPNVKVSAETTSPLDKPINYYSNFDVVCATKQPSDVYVCLNNICKFHNIKFYCGDSFGMFGYLFEDSDVKDISRTPATFSEVLNYNWKPKTSLKKRKLEDPSFLLFKILMEFRKTVKRNPSRDYQSEDEKTISKLRDLVLTKFKVDDDLLPMEYLNNVYGEYGPTCSIVGGMIAQQVVKSLSKEGASVYSIFLFNHLRCQMTGMSIEETPTPPTPAPALVIETQVDQPVDDNVMEIL